uniref:CSON012961 protein n=1 Tax=Culicoides sonorensis TaxID=179676 RepID=A0A336MC68_CULSO
MKLIISTFVLFANQCIAQDPKYCDPNLCASGRAHIGCPGVAVNQCPSDAREISLTGTLRSLILERHNANRNRLAGGQLSGLTALLPARRMPTIEWDDELANLAKINAMRCTFGHDQCRNTAKFRYAGQNIGWSKGYSSDQSAIEVSLDGWWNEYKNTRQSDIDRYGSSLIYLMNSSYVIGHFTAMSQDRANRIGCGASAYNGNERIIVCNYAFTNVVGQRVYESGTTASGCTTGRNPTYTNLCSTNEVVNAVP